MSIPITGQGELLKRSGTVSWPQSPNASATVLELAGRPRLLVYGSLPDGGLATGLY